MILAFSGLLRVELTSADIPGLLRAAGEMGIEILNSQSISELVLQLTVWRRDFPKLRDLCDKRGDQLQLKKHTGLYWHGKRLLARPVLLVGILLYFLLTVFLSSRVLFVRVEGNVSVPEQRILEAAEMSGLSFGASRRNVRSEKMKNAILEAVPELQWAGVNTRGCLAVISVREREKTEEKVLLSELGHIVALRDGIVTKCTATKGNLLCDPGQAVSAGEILISGFTDCGLHIRAEQAQGEVFGQTLRNIDLRMPLGASEKGEKLEIKKKISLLIGKKRINFWKDSGIWDTTCDRMYEEYYITLPGGFILPAAIAVETYQFRNSLPATLSREEAEDFLSGFGKTCVNSQMVSGRVESQRVSFTCEEDCIRMAGEYVCTELIGIMQRLEIGETNGKDN